jgi:hypothetical protein
MSDRPCKIDVDKVSCRKLDHDQGQDGEQEQLQGRLPGAAGDVVQQPVCLP